MNYALPNFGFTYSPHDRVHLDGKPFRHVAVAPDGHLFQRTDVRDTFEYFSNDDIALKVERRDGYKHERNFFTKSGQLARISRVEELITNLKPEQRKPYLARVRFMELAQLQLKDVFSPTDADRVAAIDTAYDLQVAEIMKAANSSREGSGNANYMPKKPPLTTFKDWANRLAAMDNDPRALLDRRRNSGNREPRFSDLQVELMQPAINGYLSESRPSMEAQYDIMLKDFRAGNKKLVAAGGQPVKPPSLATFCRRINAINEFLKHAYRYGLEDAKKTFRSIGDGLHIVQPGIRSEIDGWEVELQTLFGKTKAWRKLSEKDRQRLKAKRLFVIVIMDSATRCITGIHFGMTEDAAGAIASFRLAVENKDDIAKALDCKSPWPMYSGGNMVSDNGVYVAEEATMIAMDAFGGVQRSIVGVPWLRGRIERFFRTIANRFLQHFTGRTFSNTVEKGDYDAEERASVTMEELRNLMIRWIVDVYHHTYHQGIGMTPFAAWAYLGQQTPPPPPMDQGRIAAIFGVYLPRHIYNDGVHFWNQEYQSEELQAVMRRDGVGTKARIRVDTSNLGAIAVEVDVDQYGNIDGDGPFNRKGWITVVGPEHLEGVTFWQLKMAQKALKARFDSFDPDAEEIRLAAIEEIEAYAKDAAKLRLNQIAPSAEALEAASRVYLPGLRKPKSDAAGVEQSFVMGDIDENENVVPPNTPEEEAPPAPSPKTAKPPVDDVDPDDDDDDDGEQIQVFIR